MKILAFVDIHGNMAALDEVMKKSRKADVLVCGGDLSIFENNLDKILKKLNSVQKPVLVVHGNHESEDVIINSIKTFHNIINLHQSTRSINEFNFVGHGGGGFSAVDTEFEKFGRSIAHLLTSRTVLVTHAPPHKTRLDKLNGDYRGNKSIRQFIEKYQPALAISGHLHENAGKQDKIKDTIVLNPGPKGKIIDLG